MGSLGEDSATFDYAGNAWTPAYIVTSVALDLFYDVHPLDTLAENDVTSVAPCTGMGGDEELGQGWTSE